MPGEFIDDAGYHVEDAKDRGEISEDIEREIVDGVVDAAVEREVQEKLDLAAQEALEEQIAQLLGAIGDRINEKFDLDNVFNGREIVGDIVEDEFSRKLSSAKNAVLDGVKDILRSKDKMWLEYRYGAGSCLSGDLVAGSVSVATISFLSWAFNTAASSSSLEHVLEKSVAMQGLEDKASLSFDFLPAPLEKVTKAAWLELSGMSDKEYLKKLGKTFSLIPLTTLDFISMSASVLYMYPSQKVFIWDTNKERDNYIQDLISIMSTNKKDTVSCLFDCVADMQYKNKHLDRGVASLLLYDAACLHYYNTYVSS